MTITNKRRLQALLMLAVLALTVFGRMPGTQPADAALHNVFPADVDGFPKDRFKADEAVFVTLTSDIYGGTVCVVPASVTDPGSVDCGNPAWGKAKDYVGMGTLLGFPFAGGTKNLLRPGKWRLLTTDVAMPPDGDLITQASLLLNPEQRAPYKGKELSEVFEVVSCSPNCDMTKADSQLAAWKAMATTKVPSAAKENGALAWDLASRTHKIMSAYYGGVGFGMGWGLFSAGVAGIGFDYIIPTTEDLAKQVYKRLNQAVLGMYSGIAADPPDPNFATIAEPVFSPVEHVAAGGAVTADQANYLNGFFEASMRVEAYGTASRIANERYMGAVIAGDHGAAAMQAETAADFTYLLIEQLRAQRVFGGLIATFDWMDDPIISIPDGEDPGTWWTDMVAALHTLTPADLSPADRQLLIDQGLTNAEVDEIVASWSDPDFLAEVDALDPNATPAEAMQANLADALDVIDTFERFAKWMSLNAVDEAALAPVNQKPVAYSQNIDVVQDTATTVKLAGMDPEGQPITYNVTSMPGHGTLSGTAPNLTYTPAAGYLGNDSFTFTVHDGTRTSDTATVRLVVAEPVDLPPVANAQTVNVFQNEFSAFTLTGSDPEGATVTFTVADGPTNGTLSGTAPNLTYTPDEDFYGNDSLTFTVNDGTLTSAPAKVSFRVGRNQPPSGRTQTHRIVPGLPKAFVVYGWDPDRRPITFTITDQPEHGTLTGDMPNLTYSVGDSYVDTDSFTYTVSDGVHTSTPATVTFVPEAVTARDDALTVQGSQIIDVAFNDTPVGVTVVDVTEPEHGTVSCSPYGMCLFVADEGYVGPDSFEYTLKSGPNESTATVTVTVEAPPVAAVGKPVADDDVLATPAGTPGTVDVLANDTGDGTLTATPSDGEHGTVICEVEGRCTYTPTDAAFEGFDQFSYTLSNGTDVDTGLVRVRVGNPAEGLAVASGSASAAPESFITWLIRMVRNGPVETSPAPDGSVRATVSGSHGYVADSARTAAGWNLTVDGDQLTATPGADALIGDQATALLPRPLPPISQGTGGDGHVPILVGSKVFAFFHHQNPTEVTCVDRATGQLCPNYPMTVPVGTRNTPGPGAVVGTQIWVHMYARNYQTSGMFCWDTATNQTCGMVANQPGNEIWEGTAPLLIDGKLWFGTAKGRLRCVDPATSAACDVGPIDTGVTFRYDYGDIVNHGTKVYVSNYTKATCIDVATGERCDGWPEDGHDLKGNMVRSHDGTTGAVNGVCGVNTEMYCVLDDDPSTVATTQVAWASTDTTYSASVEAEAGTRTFWPANGRIGLGCFDWSTMALCVGPAFNSLGFSSRDIGRGYLPSAYGAVWDGSCAVALGDAGQLFTMDFEGSSPCTSLDSGAAPLKIDLRLQRFDGQVGAATWDRVRVFDTDLSADANFTSFLVTVRDGATGQLVASQEMVDTDGVLDLSGVDPASHPSLTIGATSRSVDGGEAWAEGHAPKVQLMWNADAAPLGFRTLAASCSDDPVGPLVVSSASGDLTARGDLRLDALPRCTPLPTTTTTSLPTTPGETPTTLPGSTLPGNTPDPTTQPVDLGGESGNPQGWSRQPTTTAAPPPAVHQTALPLTGTRASRLTPFGGLAVVFGTAAVLLARRRRIIR